MREIDMKNCTVTGRLGGKQSTAARVVANLAVVRSCFCARLKWI